jgi:hypothetical protein
MRKKVFVSIISLIIFVSIGVFFTSCNLSDIIPDIDIGSIWEVFGYNKPANLQALTVSDSQIYLSWEDKVTGEDGFVLEWGTNFQDYPNQILIEKNETDYYHKPLSPSSWFFYRIYAYDASGNSTISNVAGAQTNSEPVASPEAPTNLHAQAISDTRIEFSWEDNSSYEDGFKIFRSPDDSTYTQIDTTDPNIASYTDTGLTQSTLYYYKVLAYNSVNESDDDSAAEGPTSATTLTAPSSAPDAPTNLQAQPVSNMRIDLTWSDNSDNEEAFIVQISMDNATFTTIGEVKPNVTAYQSTSLKPETTYYYRIYATNSTGDSAVTDSANAKTLPTPGTVPAAPTNLQAKAASDTQIKLGWTDNSVDEDGFNIEMAVSATEPTSESPLWRWIAKVKPNETAYLVGGLKPEVTFWFRVSAFNFFGKSALSDAVSAKTLPEASASPAAPTNLVAKSVSDTQIAIGWYDNSNNEDGFNIYISKDNGVNYVWLTKVRPDTKEYVVGGLPPTYTFYFKVNAYNTYGVSLFSNTASATTGSTPTSPPAAPSNLVAKPASDTRIDMAWTDNSDNEDGFNIEVSGDGIRFEFLDKVGPNVKSYSLGGLKPNLTLYFRVNAFNRYGKSTYTSVAKATTLPEASGVPVAPTNLVAKGISDTQIAMEWTDNSVNEEGFNIFVSKDGTEFDWLDTVRPDVNEYVMEGLRPDLTLWFKVNAFNKYGKSEFTPAAKATTLPEAGGVPADPTNLVAKALSDTQIALGWSDNSDNEDAFNIFISKDGTNFDWWSKVKPDITEYTVGGLRPNTQYWFTVNAVNSEGASGYTDPVTATTKPEPGTVPTAPTSLIAAAKSDSVIAIAWTDNSDNEDGFNIEISLDGENFEFFDKVGANNKEYAAEGLKPVTTYYFRVNAFNSSGVSGYSSTAKATTLPEPTSIPDPPAALEAYVKGDSVIALVWRDMSDNEDGFNIEMAVGASPAPDDYRWIAKNKPNNTEFAVEGLKPNTTYSFRINAFNAEGASAYCTPVSATTLESPTSPPAAPSGLAATAKSDSVIVLVWTDNSDVEEGFILEWGPNGSNWETLDKVKPDQVEYVIEGLKPATAYYFRIFAYNGEGQSAYSDPANATTLESPEFPPAAPSALTATAVGDLTIIVEWTDNSSVEEGFFIEWGPDGVRWETLDKLPPDSDAYKMSGLKEGVTYYFRVMAYNKAGESDYSNSDSATAYDR